MKLLDEERRTLDQEFLESNGIVRLNTYRKKLSPAKFLNDGLRLTTAKTNSTYHSQFSSNETDSTSSDSFIMLPSHSEPSFNRASTSKNIQSRSSSAVNLIHSQKVFSSPSDSSKLFPSFYLKSPSTAPSLSFKIPSSSINQSNSSHHDKTIRLQFSSHSYIQSFK